VSDNVSTDGTTDVLRGLAETDPRVRLIVRDGSPLSVQDNFKSVLSEARGEFFMWASGDDFWKPRFVSSLVAELEANPKAGLAMSATQCIWDEGGEGELVRFVGADDPRSKGHGALMRMMVSFKKTNYFIYGLYRTALLRSAIGGLSEVPAPDRVFLVQLALATRFAYVDEPLYVRTLHRKKYHERREAEDAKDVRAGTSTWGAARALAAGVLRSDVVPLSRKPYAVLAAERQLRKTAVHNVTEFLLPLMKSLPSPLASWLTSVKRRISP